MKKRFIIAFILSCIGLLTYLIYPFLIQAFFNLSGSAEIPAELTERATKYNTMLFLVAKNDRGVPVAVKKIINPVFPLNFQMTQSDLILPDILTRKIFLEAFLNNHGELGVFKAGDIKGSVKPPLFIFSKKIRLIIDTPA